MDELASPTRRRAVFLLVTIFALGMLCGAALFHLGQRSIGRRPPPGPGPDHPIERLVRELDLDAEQRIEIERIADERRDRLEEILEGSRVAIRELLSPEQQERFDHMRPPRPEGRHPGPPHGARGPDGPRRPPPEHRRPGGPPPRRPPPRP